MFLCDPLGIYRPSGMVMQALSYIQTCFFGQVPPSSMILLALSFRHDSREREIDRDGGSEQGKEEEKEGKRKGGNEERRQGGMRTQERWRSTKNKRRMNGREEGTCRGERMSREIGRTFSR